MQKRLLKPFFDEILPRPIYSRIAQLSNSANIIPQKKGGHLRSITSADAKNNFGELIDLARAAPVAVTKYDRPVVVVMAVEEYERLRASNRPKHSSGHKSKVRP